MKVFIMRGVPGSGKSTLAKTIRDLYTNSRTCSADDFFMFSGEYKFDPSKLGEAHGQCLRNFSIYLHNMYQWSTPGDCLIVDNTNINFAKEAEIYARLATAFKADVTVVTKVCDVEMAIARGRHGVPADKVRSMAKGLLANPTPGNWAQETVTDEQAATWCPADSDIRSGK